MLLRRDEKERKIAQQKRLLKDFPWLWAIRDRWLLGFDDIIVRGIDDDINTRTLRYVLLENPLKDDEIWIYRSTGNRTIITRISEWNTNISRVENILYSLGSTGDPVYYIVFVCKVSIDQFQFAIYRPRKCNGAFNRLIGDLSNFARASRGQKV